MSSLSSFTFGDSFTFGERGTGRVGRTLDVLGDGAAASAIAARRFRAGINAEA